MKFIAITLFLLYKIHQFESRMLPYGYTASPQLKIDMSPQLNIDIDSQPIIDLEKVERELMFGPKIYDERDGEDDLSVDKEKVLPSKPWSITKKPCAIIVMSNVQNPYMQSLLRRYRYDSNGILIPSSVKYFIKLPQGDRESPVLVPLNENAFSPLGGFVRYYKEVPPIPHSF